MAKVIIGTPVGKDCQIDIRTAGYCHLEAQSPGVEWRYAATRSAGSSRSQIARLALEDLDVTHVFTVDSDTIPPTGTLQRLLSYNLPIVAGIYPLSLEDGIKWSFMVDDEWWPMDKPLPDGLIEATAIAGSSHLVKREVFESLEWPWYKGVFEFDGDGTDRSYGEDMYFSKNARAAGWKLIVDPSVICDHFNYVSLLSMGGKYTMVYDNNR
jgi:hypothetical protein